MRMKKIDFINELKRVTNKSEEECVMINDILENHFIVGHNNKEKIKKDFIEKMQMTEEEANKLYNTCSELIVKGIFKK